MLVVGGMMAEPVLVVIHFKVLSTKVVQYGTI